MTETREARRYECMSCERCIETGKEGKAWLRATGGNPGINRALEDFRFYCKYTDSGKARQIAPKADYTGLLPKWCPKL